MKPDLLDEVSLKCIFEPLKAAQPNAGVFTWSGGVLFTSIVGFHSVVSHLESRLQRSKQKVWNWHEVHYVPSSEDGFLEPSVGTSYVVNITFCFDNVGTQPTQAASGIISLEERPWMLCTQQRTLQKLLHNGSALIDQQ